MSLPTISGTAQLLTDPKTGPTKSGGTWTNAVLKFQAWRKVDDEWTEGDAVIGAVIAFDDAAQSLLTFSKGDIVTVEGTATVALWKDQPQLRITANTVAAPERRKRSGQSGDAAEQPRQPQNRPASTTRTADREWPRPGGATVSHLRDASRSRAGRG